MPYRMTLQERLAQSGADKLPVASVDAGAINESAFVEQMNSSEWEMAERILAESPLFRDLQPSVRQTLLRRLKPEHWSRRSSIMDPRQRVDRFYLVIKGRVKITRQNLKTAREITLFLLGPGSAFGLVGLADGLFGSVCVETLDDVVALSGPASLWEAWVATYPMLRESMSAYVAGHLSQLAELASDLALHDTKTRLARLILRNLRAEAACFDGEDALIRDLPHEELGCMIGSVRVVVNRLIAELKREGVIDTRAGGLQVLDYEKLVRIAELDRCTSISALPSCEESSPN